MAESSDQMPEDEQQSAEGFLVGFHELPVQYVNILQASHDPAHFQLVFARLLAEPALGPRGREALLARTREEGIPIVALGHFVVPPPALRDFVEILQGQLKAYEASFGPIPSYGLEAHDDDSQTDDN